MSDGFEWLIRDADESLPAVWASHVVTSARLEEKEIGHLLDESGWLSDPSELGWTVSMLVLLYRLRDELFRENSSHPCIPSIDNTAYQISIGICAWFHEDGPAVVTSASTYVQRLSILSASNLLQRRSDLWGSLVMIYSVAQLALERGYGFAPAPPFVCAAMQNMIRRCVDTLPQLIVPQRVNTMVSSLAVHLSPAAVSLLCAYITLQHACSCNAMASWPSDPYLRQKLETFQGALRTCVDTHEELHAVQSPLRRALFQTISTLPPTHTVADAPQSLLNVCCGGGGSSAAAPADLTSANIAAARTIADMLRPFAGVSGFGAVQAALHTWQAALQQRSGHSPRVIRPPPFVTAPADAAAAREDLLARVRAARQ